jgi:hypothetical protein
VPAVAQAIEAATDDTAAGEAADDRPTPPTRNTAAAAWMTVLILGGLAVALLVTMAFSATNTGQSVDGRTATSWSPEPNE